MSSGWKSARVLVALVAPAMVGSACQTNDDLGPSQTAAKTAAQSAVAAAGNVNGAAGQMPTYYDGELFTVNMMELSEAASASIIAKNPGFNEIYTTKDLDEPQEFFPVIDAIQGDGFNPLWRQILIVFNPGFTPHQFTSDEEVEAAAAGANPEITLIETDEVYRCSVVGRK